MQVSLLQCRRLGWCVGEQLFKRNLGHSGCCRTKTTPALAPTPLPSPGFKAADMGEEMSQMKGKDIGTGKKEG